MDQLWSSVNTVGRVSKVLMEHAAFLCHWESFLYKFNSGFLLGSFDSWYCQGSNNVLDKFHFILYN
jgi:hypothetical protein